MDEEKPIDYSNFFGKNSGEGNIAQNENKKRKKNIFSEGKKFWLKASKKEKIELMIFIFLLLAILSSFVYWLVLPKGNKQLPPPPINFPPEEMQMFSNK